MANRPNIDHNVYILGAGFSADAGIPVVNSFLERMADAVEWLHRSDRNAEANAIGSVFEFRLRAAGAAYRAEINVDNIEELFSLASASEGESLANQVTTAIAATIDFAELTAQKKICVLQVKEDVTPTSWNRKDVSYPLYELYAGIMSGKFCVSSPEIKNTVITLNYDTILEDAFTLQRIPFTYGLPGELTVYDKSAKCQENEAEIPIYKLHGSINWSKPERRGDKATVYGNYKDLARHNDDVLLIPPTWRKVFAEHLVSVWENAVRAINNATRIVVIGFSMPRTDTHFKYLIAAGLQHNISLRKFIFVNSGLENEQQRDALTTNLFSILRPELERRHVIELVALKAADFLLQKEYQRKIARQFRDTFLGVQYFKEEYSTNYIARYD